ncbi:hypothetical protein AhyVDH1_057 [Aeromonas phage AhyVDH1]|nr:hypothetical protein AhyVDH1_057 [Aeromonas phage AhyVDH1]
MTMAKKYPVRATCIKTGTTYEWPSIVDATLDTGFTYNMIKLCISGQCKSYSGLRWTTTAQLRSPGPSPRIIETANLYKTGITIPEIAKEMGISVNTAKFHIQRAKALNLIELRRPRHG